MRTYDDTFSGQRIYPGKVRNDDISPNFIPSGPRLGGFPILARVWARAWEAQAKLEAEGQPSFADLASLGKLYVRGDSKVFRFQNGKSESLFLQRKNPAASHGPFSTAANTGRAFLRYDLPHSTEVAKKRTRRAVKSQRAVVGASLDVIKERRTMRPEARAAARAEAIAESKEKKQAAASAKKAEKAKLAATTAKGQTGRIQSKQGAKGAHAKPAAAKRF
ncbi:unnamed protein product [Parascedosporium putredinis]|uniref:Large ribosomal subunit protein eL24-related N-terminal domain-containing protein n=1 Tax=Parascedosporium putredinis TaxID=1442378 RepID=A0A9P1GW50_9PEZI|nr:unnamed protein product [Parascedosporium putredinis]CAI7988126.1 unnamed protein product [Parascedosporium putredinis]